MRVLKSTISQKAHSLIKRKKENRKILMILGNSAKFRRPNQYANITTQMKILTKIKK